MPSSHELYEQGCPFCGIVAAYPAPSNSCFSIPSTTDFDLPGGSSAYVILNTPHVIAFLDHAPISRGHVLVVVRQHREKLSDLKIEEGRALGSWLGIISRAAVGTVDPAGVDGKGGALKEDVGDWNVVQNNGTFEEHMWEAALAYEVLDVWRGTSVC